MKTKKQENAILQNLKDAGCDYITTQRIMDDLYYEKNVSAMRRLALHRQKQLDIIHEKQKYIDCLDYLIYQLKKDIK